MPFTIEKLLTLSAFKDCILIAGTKGKNNKILCVDTMEVPNISPWLRKGELLITTGYSIMNHTETLLPLLQNMKKAECAGIAIKTKFIGPLQDEVLDQAETMNLPVIIMPDNKPFIPLLNTVINGINEDELKSSDLMLEITQEIEQAQLSDNYVEGMCEIVYRHINSPVLMTDYLFNPISSFPHDTVIDVLSKDFQDSLLLQPDFRSKEAHLFVYKTDDLHFKNIIVQKIRYKSIICGYLFLPCRDESVVEDGCDLDKMLHRISYSLAFYMSNMQNQSDAMYHRNISLYSKCLNGADFSDSMISYLCDEYAWPKPPVYLVTISMPNFNPASGNQISSKQQQLLWITKRIFRESQLDSIEIPIRNTVRCLLSAEKEEGDVIKLLEKLYTELKENLDLDTCIALSKKILNYDEIIQAHQEASYLLTIGARLNINVCPHSRLSLELALVYGADHTLLKEFEWNTLQNIVDYDSKNGTELLKTLECLVKNMGVRSKAAEDLFLHRNSMTNRVKRIEELSGLNLSSSEGIQRAYLALRISSLLDRPMF